MTYEEFGDPETHARIQEYEMAFRMQTSVPELTDMRDEPASTWTLYGEDAKKPGTFAYNCLLARRMAERGVRFTQIYQRGWDVHGDVVGMLPKLVRGHRSRLLRAGHRFEAPRHAGRHAGHLGRRIWPHGLQPGRPLQNQLRTRSSSALLHRVDGGRRREDRNCYGETDDFCYNIVRDPVHVRDFNATLLHLLGIDHEKLTFKFQGLDQKFTGVIPAKVVTGLLS